MGPFFPKARYMNGVGFEILARTPVPKLPLSYHPHPPGFCSISSLEVAVRLYVGFSVMVLIPSSSIKEFI